MAFVVARKTQALAESGNFKETVLRELGDLNSVDVFHNMVLIATYIPPEKTKGGIILAHKSVEENLYQGKVGLVVKKGPMAFVDDGATEFHGQTAEVGDYIVYRPSDAWDVTIRGVGCRLIPDTRIKMRVEDPDSIY